MSKTNKNILYVIIDKTKLEIFLNKPIANSIGETIGDINWVG